MIRKGLRKPNGKWDTGRLYAVKKEKDDEGSVAYLNRVLKGEVNFTLDYYEGLIQALGFDFEFVISAITAKPIKRSDEVESLHVQLDGAIENASKAGTLRSLKVGLLTLANCAKSDKEEHDKLRETELPKVAERSPPPK